MGTTQAESVEIFNGYFPDFLQGRWDTTYISLAFCVLAIILSIFGLKISVRSWQNINISILVIGSLLLLLNLFSMM
jgi:1-acyl-sn-glycerol-3-phosphate acyltransferase